MVRRLRASAQHGHRGPRSARRGGSIHAVRRELDRDHHHGHRRGGVRGHAGDGCAAPRAARGALCAASEDGRSASSLPGARALLAPLHLAHVGEWAGPGPRTQARRLATVAGHAHLPGVRIISLSSKALHSPPAPCSCAPHSLPAPCSCALQSIDWGASRGSESRLHMAASTTCSISQTSSSTSKRQRPCSSSSVAATSRA